MRKDPILGVMLLVGLGLRFWKIDGDLPVVFHFDEPTLIDNAVWMLQSGTLHPHFFHYPTGMIYLLAALFGLLLLGGMAVGRFETWAAAIGWVSAGTYARPPGGEILYFYPTFGVPALYLIGRGLSAVAGTATIAVVYQLARYITNDRRTGRIAAMLLMLSPLAVEHSRLVTTDMIATACATAVLLIVVKDAATGRSRWRLAGAMAGLAAGMKYNAGLVAISIPILALTRGGRSLPAVLGKLVQAAAVAVLVFLLTTPFAVLDLGSFAHDLSSEFHRVATVTTVFEGADAVNTTAAEKMASIVRHNLGIVGMVVGVLGLLFLLRSKKLVGLAVLFWIAALVVPQMTWQRLYPRYLLLIWPTVLVLVAIGIDRLPRLLFRSPSVERLTTQVLLAGVLILPTLRLIQLERSWSRPDPRVEMTEWLEANLPEGERVVSESGGPFPTPERFSIETIDFLGRSTPDDYLGRGIRYLAGSGQESRIVGEEAFAAILLNLDRIRAQSDTLWHSGRYTIYRLIGGPEWIEPVEHALLDGDSNRARQLLEDVVKGETAGPYAWKRFGELCVATGDTATAIDAYRMAARLDSLEVEASLAVSNLLLAREDFAGAIDALDRSRSVAPNDPLLFHNLAVAYLSRAQNRYRKGDVKGGREDWTLAREHALQCRLAAPNDPNLARIAEQVERMGRKWGFLP